MRVLAIDTVTEMCSVALSIEGKCIHRAEKAINRHSALVLDMVEALLIEAGIDLGQLDLIIDDVGPGSFTGIRIGMGVAQGLAYAADLPLLGVDALASLAQGARDQSQGVIHAAIDARMGQIYCAQYTHVEGLLTRQGDMQLLNPHDMEVTLQPVYGTGSGWDSYADVLGEKLNLVAYARERFPMAQDGLAIGLTKPRSEWLGTGELLPVYLRNDVAKVSNKSLL